MRRRVARISIASAGLLGASLLSGCGGGDDSPPSVPEDQLREEAALLTKPKPGLYRSNVSLKEFSADGFSPQDASRVKDRFLSLEKEETTLCLSPEEAEDGFDKFIEQIGPGNCSVERFETSAEFINAAMVCSGEGGVDSRISVQGRGSEEQSRITLEIQQSIPQYSDQPIAFTLEIENVRVGDCPKDSDKEN